jgi:hypothetical protein
MIRPLVFLLVCLVHLIHMVSLVYLVPLCVKPHKLGNQITQPRVVPVPLFPPSAPQTR